MYNHIRRDTMLSFDWLAALLRWMCWRRAVLRRVRYARGKNIHTLRLFSFMQTRLSIWVLSEISYSCCSLDVGGVDIDNFTVFWGFRSSRSAYITQKKPTNGYKKLGIIDRQLRFFAKFSKVIVLDVLIDILLAVSVRRFRKSVQKKKNQHQHFFYRKQVKNRY